MERKEFTVTSEAIKPNIASSKTQIIFQRHGDHENGELTSESVEDQKKITKRFMQKLINSYPTEFLKNISFLFVASPTMTEEGFKRSVTTTDIAMQMITLFYQELGLPTANIINLSSSLNFKGKIKETKKLEGSKIFEENTGYAEFLLSKHGEENDDFWEDFDNDTEEEKRKELNSEGPDEIADRTINYLRVLKRYSDIYHRLRPESRLIVWCGTHYDNISPLVKRDFLHYQKTDVAYVDNCGGISFNFDENDEITVTINEQQYDYKLPEIKEIKR